jgi:phage shock protein A
MRRRDLLVLRQTAGHALDRHKRGVREQMEAVEALEGALARIDRETRDERLASEGDARCALLMPHYLQEQRVRHERLAGDLAAGREELDRRVQAAHEQWLEIKRYDEMIERALKLERAEAARRENAFSDWLGERQHARARHG